VTKLGKQKLNEGARVMRKLAVLSLLLWGCILAAQQPQDLQTVLQQLQSQDNATRLQAIERAPEFGAAIIPHLTSLLTHQDWAYSAGRANRSGKYRNPHR
jgi:hypothetical protein